MFEFCNLCLSDRLLRHEFRPIPLIVAVDCFEEGGRRHQADLRWDCDQGTLLYPEFEVRANDNILMNMHPGIQCILRLSAGLHILRRLSQLTWEMLIPNLRWR